MRFDTPVYFQFVMRGEYDENTGDYADDVVVEEMVFADVTNAGEKAMTLHYGRIKEGALVVRLQNHYKNTFHRIRIGDKLYNVDFCRNLSLKQTFIVSEVQSHA